MSITSVKEISEGRGGDETYSKNKSVMKDTRVFRVLTDNNYDSCSDVLANATIPILGQQHPKDTSLCCNSRNAKQNNNSKRTWIVNCEYTTDWSSSDGGGLNQNPTLDRALVEWSTETTQVSVHKDKDGNWILNSAGQQFIDGIRAEDSRWTATVTKNVPFVPVWILNYRNAINSGSFLLDGVSIPARAAKIRQISISHWQIRNKVWFKQLKFVIKLQDDWKLTILDQGLYQIDGTPVTDKNGQESRIPLALNGSGYQLDNPTPSSVVGREFHIYPELSFALLPLI